MLIITVLVFILILGILVLSHELGHLLAAKKLGVRVHEFGFGFPPTLWKKKIKNTVYKINVIPLGGYVKEDTEGFAKKSLKTRFIILIAGAGMNILVGVLFLTFISFWFYPWYQAVFMGIINAIELLGLIIFSLFILIKSLILTGGVPGEIFGPIGIAQLTNQFVEQGFLQVIYFIALLSINIAVINIFPFPALDGGRLLMLGIEKIKGKKINPKTEHAIHAAGFAFLILLMILVTWKDIARIF